MLSPRSIGSRTGLDMPEVREDFNFNSLGGGAFAWIDFDDKTTLFQDTAATVPVTDYGQSILRVSDKSGNGRHFTNATSANCPTWERFAFNGTKSTASFNIPNASPSTKYLSSAAISTFDMLYLGGSFTVVMHIAHKSNLLPPQMLLDSNESSTGIDGCMFYLLDSGQSRTYTMHLTNSRTHTTGSGKTLSTEQDAEYIYGVYEHAATELAIGFQNDVNTGYIKVGSHDAVAYPAIGSPAAAGAYPLRIGATASSGYYGWRGYIRRIVFYNSFLSAADFQTALTKITL